jgi:hypothetical protein
LSNRGSTLASNSTSPRMPRTARTTRRRSDAICGRSIGMKSTTSAMADSERNRVTRMAVSGMYICFVVRAGVAGA